MTFQEIILELQRFWAARGCVVMQPYDTPVGAGTFHPATTLRALGPGSWATAYVQPCRRPTDGRYGENPNRMQHYYQFQVLIKPSPDDCQELYLESLRAIGIEPRQHDVRFVEDDWESPTLGAWGLGWEVWLNGMEVTQFTYFQQVGGLECSPVPVEITYGLERLAMYIQQVDSVFDIVWSRAADGRTYTYGDVFLENEREFSAYNFELADTTQLFAEFNAYERECQRILDAGLPLPAYDCVLRCSHAFNLLDARGAIAATERMGYILRVRTLAKACCEAYAAKAQALGEKSATGAAAEAAPATPSAPAAPPTQPANLVFEIGTEEIPSAPLYAATAQLKSLAEAALAEARIEHGAVSVSSTPRRLVLEVKRLASASTPLLQRFRGPAAAIAFDAEGQPTKAAEGFARGKGIAVRDLLRAREGDVEYVYAQIEQFARPTESLLPELLHSLIEGLEWPKSQRWASYPERFVRPVRWLCALWGSYEVPVQFAGLVAGRYSRGHRLLAEAPVEVASADDYESALTKAWVVSSAEMRSGRIRAQVKSFEEASGLNVYLPKATLDEVVNLVEFPTTLVGHFDAGFLQVPSEMIIDTLLSHQRCFPVYDSQRQLVNQFLVVSNGSPSYNTDILAGHERVVRPRLSDAAFFYSEDLKVSLDERVAALERVVFHEKLGTLKAKTRRLEQLAANIAAAAAFLPAEQEKCLRAAHLAKADLVTHAVVEFTALQGIMGSYYAAAAGEAPEVAAAIAEHYRPRFAGDELPASLAGSVVALADKLDTLCGIFAVGQGPTGSSDPFALRRAAIGIINILALGLEGRLAILSLRELIGFALAAYSADGLAFDNAKATAQIRDFFATRLEVMARDQGFAPDTIAAVMAVGVLDPAEVFKRCRLLAEQREQKAELFTDLATAFARANNLRQAELGSTIDTELLGEAESALLSAIEKVDEGVQSALEGGRYDRTLDYLATLRAPIDRFFEDVMIMDNDPALRENRLRLLNRFVAVFANVADFGKLEG